MSSVTAGVHFGGIIQFPGLILKHDYTCFLALHGGKYMKTSLGLLLN